MTYDASKTIDHFVRKRKLPARFLADSMLKGGNVKLLNRILENLSSQALVDELYRIDGASQRNDQIRILLRPSPLSRSKTLWLLQRYGFDVRHHARFWDGTVLVICKSRHSHLSSKQLYSAIIPCRNEAESVHRIPDIFLKTGHPWELVFVEGNSSDNTLEMIKEIERDAPAGIQIQAFQQVSKGKAGAVFEGFDRATGDFFFIFDGDATVRTEDLLGMGRYLEREDADFCNGDRLFFDRAKGSMKTLNRVGNSFFALCHLWVTGKYHADVFCGTKAFSAELWPALKAAKRPFEGHDRYGDFQLLFAAYELGLNVESFPVHYLARVAGVTTLNPFVEGMNFSRATLQAKRFLKRRAAEL